METGEPSNSTIYQIREQLSSISIGKALVYTILWLIPFAVLLFAIGISDTLTDLRFEIFVTAVLYLLPLALIFYAFKKKNLTLQPLLKDTGQYRKEVLMVVPLMMFSISVVWVTILVLNLFDAGLAQAYLDYMNSLEFMQTTPDTPLVDYLFVFFVIAVLPPILEEVVFRGSFIERLGRKYSFKTAVIISSILFGVLHIDIFGSLMFGLILSLIYLKTFSLYIPIVIHAIYNGLCVVFIFFDDRFLRLEPWEQTESYIATGWIGLLMFAISAVWLSVYLKQNWHLVHQKEPVPKAGSTAEQIVETD